MLTIILSTLQSWLKSNKSKRKFKGFLCAFPFIILIIFYRSTVNFGIYEVQKFIHTPTNALYIKLDKVLKFTLKIT